jgi:hypothetical protein
VRNRLEHGTDKRDRGVRRGKGEEDEEEEREEGDDEDEDIIKKKKEGRRKRRVLLGGGRGCRKVRAACPHAFALARKTSLSFLFYLFILAPRSQRAPSPLILYYVNSPNTPLHRVLHSHTSPYTYKYSSLDHPF